jgi:hypothetical protein
VKRVSRVVVLSILVACTLTSAPRAEEDVFGTQPHLGLPIDWSHRHMLYTQAGSVQDMMQVRSDPRFLHSYLARNLHRPLNWPRPRPRRTRTNFNSHVDWAVSLGASGGFPLGEYPAKYSYDVTATPSCANDFVVFTITAAPRVGTQANLVGINNLYSGTNPTGMCGTAPTFLFSYAIGTSGSTLSPVVSTDGTKVAWIDSSNPALFHVTTWARNQGTNATTGAVAVGGGSSDFALNYTNTAAPGCAASPNADPNADPYIDFSSDSAYLTSNNGILYHVSGVFKGTPTVNFCIPVNTAAGRAMSGPVYDSLHGTVYVSDSKTIYAYNVGANSFTLVNKITYSNSNLSAPPIVDVYGGYVYTFSMSDTTGAFTIVSQMPLNLASKVDVHLGPASTAGVRFLFSGDFDNNYYSFGPTDNRSTLYTCGTNPANTATPALYAISFQASGVVNTTPAMSANTNVNPGGNGGICSPLLNFFDGTTDRLFLGTGNPVGTGGANVVQMWNITNRLTSPTTLPTASASPYYGGTSGFVVDNVSASPQAASFYFGTLRTLNSGAVTCGNNNYCAVKLTQSGLQ